MDSEFKAARLEYTDYVNYFEKLRKIKDNFYENGGLPNPVTSWWIGLCATKKLLVMKNELKKGSIYRGDCRNASFASWQGDRFIHIRSKFGSEFLEEINHFEDDNGSDLFKPYFEITEKDLRIPIVRLEVNKLNKIINEPTQQHATL